MYQLLKKGIKRLEDGAYIPECEDNKDWIEYQEWLQKEESNIPKPLEETIITFPKTFTRRQIRLAMRSLGIESKLDEILKDPVLYRDWQEEANINITDPQLISALVGKEVDTQAVVIKIMEMNLL